MSPAEQAEGVRVYCFAGACRRVLLVVLPGASGQVYKKCPRCRRMNLVHLDTGDTQAAEG